MSENPTASTPLSGDDAILASRYIGALFELAEKEGAVDAVISDMRNLQNLWQESPEWRFVATDPRIGHEAVMTAAKQVAKIAGVSKLTSNFLAIIAQNRRLNLLPMLIENFIDEVGVRRGQFRADVRTAIPLTDSQRDKLTVLLSAATKGQIRLAVTEDSSIIGGMTIKIGSQFVDASVKTKLDLLERTLRGKTAA